MRAANLHPDTREVFFRNTSKEGSVHFSSHWAWDVDHFAAMTQGRAIDAGGRAERITKEQYLKGKK